jgi:DNA-binding GntR family transcriptional regulator
VDFETVEPVRREDESLADFAYRVLRDRLVLLEIPPGAPINDAELAQPLGIGRTPVREALKRLEVDHLVSSFPRRGTFATTVDITDLAEISEIRERLEPLAAERAARLASPAMRLRITEIAEALEALDVVSLDRMVIMRSDLVVHRTIHKAAASRQLEGVLGRLDNLATRVWCVVLDRLPPLDGHVREHIELLRHIASGRVEEARDLAHHHATVFERLVRSVL